MENIGPPGTSYSLWTAQRSLKRDHRYKLTDTGQIDSLWISFPKVHVRPLRLYVYPMLPFDLGFDFNVIYKHRTYDHTMLENKLSCWFFVRPILSTRFGPTKDIFCPSHYFLSGENSIDLFAEFFLASGKSQWELKWFNCDWDRSIWRSYKGCICYRKASICKYLLLA